MKPNAPLQRAMLLLQQGRPADAERELRGVLAQDPNDGFAHAMLALTLCDLKRAPEASEEAELAVGAAPDLPLAHYARAKALLDRHYLASAADAVHEAVRLDSGDPDHFALLAAIRIEQRRWADALAAADEGLRFHPEHAGCVNLRSVALVQLGRREEAGAAIGAALARDPQNAHTHANQGWAMLHEGNPKAALVHFRESLRIDPEGQWARAGMVEALKARYVIYRWMLLYFLFMVRLSGRAQWGIIVGGYVGAQALRAAAKTNPAVAPVVWPLLIAYVGFVALTWLSVPFFNLLLRLNRFGRYALTREQTVTSNLIGGLLLGAVGCLVWFGVTGQVAALFAALVCAMLCIPTSSVFNCHAGWPRWAMAAVTVGLAAAGFTAVGLELSLAESATAGQAERSMNVFRAFGIGVLLSSFLANHLVSVRPKQ